MRLIKQTEDEKRIEKHITTLFKRARRIKKIKTMKKIKHKMKI